MGDHQEPRHWDELPDTLLKDGSQRVLPEWIDYNGHMNLAFYVLAFDRQTDLFMDAFGMDAAYRERHDSSLFVGETHVMYLSEVGLDDPLNIATQLLGVEERKIHFFHLMFHGGTGDIVATNELMSYHMDMGARRSTPFPPVLATNLEEWRQRHAGAPVSRWAGRSISL